MPATPPYNEKELFTLIAEGDEIAFRKLFDIYGDLIRVHALKILHDEGLVADLIQDVFLRIWLKRDMLPQVEQPQAWILQIAYYQSFNLLKKRKIREDVNIDAAKITEDIHRNPVEEDLLFAEITQVLQQAIANLPPQARRAYLLSREEGMKIADIAETMGLSQQTVKNTLGRALKSIREYLQERGIYLPLLLLCYHA